MAALDTVGKVIDYAHVLLQDVIEPYRYPTDELIQILNVAQFEARRMRPDLFLGYLKEPTALPEYTSIADAFTVDQQYRLAFVYFVVGQAQLRDEEDTQDARASALLLKFGQTLSEPFRVG